MARTPVEIMDELLKKTIEFERRVNNFDRKMNRTALAPFDKLDKNSETILDDMDDMYMDVYKQIKKMEKDFEKIKSEYNKTRPEYLKYARGASIDVKNLDELEKQFAKIDSKIGRLYDALERKYTLFMRSL